MSVARFDIKGRWHVGRKVGLEWVQEKNGRETREKNIGNFFFFSFIVIGSI